MGRNPKINWSAPNVVQAFTQYNTREIRTQEDLRERIQRITGVHVRQGTISKRYKLFQTQRQRRDRKRKRPNLPRSVPQPANDNSETKSSSSKAKASQISRDDMVYRLTQHLNKTLILRRDKESNKAFFLKCGPNADGAFQYECNGCNHAKYGERKAARKVNAPPVPPNPGRVKRITVLADGTLVDNGDPHLPNCHDLSDIEVAVHEIERREAKLIDKRGMKPFEANKKTLLSNVKQVAAEFDVTIDQVLDNMESFPFRRQKGHKRARARANETAKADPYSDEPIIVGPTDENWNCATDREMGILVLATQSNLVNFANSPVLVMDATFSPTPSPFTQLFIIHAKIGENFGPVIHVLMETRDEGSYNRVFELIQNELAKHKLELKSTTIITDFERAERNAVKRFFPNANVLGCLFHWAQAVLRKAFSLGFKEAYMKGETDPIWRWIRDIVGLPLLPPIRTTWFELFDYEVEWNHWLNYGPRTTNVAEGYHSRLKRTIPARASFSLFLESMIGNQSTELHKHRRWLLGRDIIKQNPVYAFLHVQIQASKDKLERLLNRLAAVTDQELLHMWNSLDDDQLRKFIVAARISFGNNEIVVADIRELIEFEVVNKYLHRVSYLLADPKNRRKRKLFEFIKKTSGKQPDSKKRKTAAPTPGQRKKRKVPTNTKYTARATHTRRTLSRLPHLDGLGLTNEEFVEVTHLFQNAQQASNRHVLTHFNPTDTLTDESIHLFLQYLSRRSRSKLALPSVHCMNWTFYRRCNTLLNGAPPPRERVTAEEHVQTALYGTHDMRNALLETDLVLVPIFTGIEATIDNPNPPPGHWSLAVIDNRFNSINYYDSLPAVTRADNVLQVLQHFLVQAKQRDIDRYNQDKSTQLHQPTPRQNNGYDCGVFVLAFSSYICSNSEINTSQAQMQHWRQLTGYLSFCRPNDFDRLDFLMQ